MYTREQLYILDQREFKIWVLTWNLRLKNPHVIKVVCGYRSISSTHPENAYTLPAMSVLMYGLVIIIQGNADRFKLKSMVFKIDVKVLRSIQ